MATRWASVTARPIRRTTSGREPEGAPLEEQGLGWKNKFGKGNAGDTITSGLEGAWTFTPVKWSHDFFKNLFKYEWELVKSPAGAWQWTPKGMLRRPWLRMHTTPNKTHRPFMLTTDLSLRMDPVYAKISKRFLENPEEFNAAFARAWYKLTHRGMGPHSRLLGPLVPEAQLWQDPVPAVDHELVAEEDVAALKSKILDSGLSISQLVSTAWASAATYRGTDKRGGANGARIRLAPQKDWEVNQPAELAKVLRKLEAIQQEFNDAQSGGKKISLADLIVLGGCAAVEAAAKKAGHDVQVPFAPRAHRRDAGDDRRGVVCGAEADRGRIPQLPGQELRSAGAGATRGSGAPVDADRTRDDGARRRHAGPERELRTDQARCLHRSARDADQRLLRQLARHGHGVEEIC